MLLKKLIQLRSKVDRAVVQGVRSYTFHTPISKGKHRIYLAALKLCQSYPDGLPAITPDGRRFQANLSTGMQSTLYFLGEYEKAITLIVEKIIRANSCTTFLDVGANFGWYTSLFSKYAVNGGQVHAFEPVPSIFTNLQTNVALLGNPSNVFINNLALGDKNGEMTINLFSGLSTGHASLSDQGRDDAISFKCEMKTLDSYLSGLNVGPINFVKVDIEGAEKSFLAGAGRLFEQQSLPIILMEMALNQTKNFGYLPDELIDTIRSKGNYRFYKIDESQAKLIEIDGFERNDIGANVICIPDAIAAPSIAGVA